MKLTSGLVLTGLLTTTAAAQAPVKARPLGPITAISKETVGSVNGVRQLPNGSILVNDAGRRRLVLLDSSLQGTVVIADTAAGAPTPYAQSGGTLMPYVADSTLFLDLAAQAFVVIDPNGKITHVMAVPRSNDMFNLIQGSPGFDAKGRMVYRVNFPRALLRTADGGIQQAPAPDSQPLIRVNLETRKVDTIATVRVPKVSMVSQTTSTGMTMMRSVQAPLPLVDDWAVLENGSVAMLRGQDYHVDWIMADGSKASTGKMSFDWRRLTDDDKIALVDSITNARNQPASGGSPMGPAMAMGTDMLFTRMASGGGDIGGGRGNVTIMGGGAGPAPAASAPASTATTSAASPASTASSSAPASASAGNGPANAANAAATNANRSPAASIGSSAAAASAQAPAAQSGAASADAKQTASIGLGTPANPGQAEKLAAASMIGSMPPVPAPAAADIPDYMPPFRPGAIRPDRDSNIWVQTSITASAPGNVIYDVINSKGELADRIEIPKGYTIIGFGKGGVIYLTHRENAALKVVRTVR